MKLLAGDIGGTNTRLVFAEYNTGGRHILAEKSYPSSDYTDFNQIINEFFKENAISESIDAACFAVAGPVKFGVVDVTNLPWVIHEDELKELLSTNYVKLINDFIAVSYGISELEESDFVILQKGNGNQVNLDAAVVGAGTGLGASHLIWKDDYYQPHASEAGHAGFAPENQLQSKLLSWLQETHSHVSLEMLLSGGGLFNIYQFLNQVMAIPDSADIKAAMQNTDPAQVITESALLNNDDLCVKTLDCFIDIYGAAAGNIALHYYPIGELYIAGGIAPKIKNMMLNQRFIDAFINKAAMTANMKNLTVKLICQDKVGLYGALSHARLLV